MAFSDETIRAAWRWAGGTHPPSPSSCECRRITHTHGNSRCQQKLIWENRGKAEYGGWEAHSVSGRYVDAISDCEILCWSCHSSLAPEPHPTP